MTIKELDQKARALAQNFIKLEAELLQIIMQMDLRKGFYKLGYNSLFTYTTKALNLSPAQAYNFIKVARKSHEVPKLKEEIQNGNLSLSKAQKMTTVLTKENQEHWLKLAQKKSHRQLEKEVALASPQHAIQERAQYISKDNEVKESIKIKQDIARIQLKLGVSENLILKLRRAQDLESQRLKKNQGLEDTLENILEVYLNKMDPVRKAQRQKIRGKLQSRTSELPHSTREENLATACQSHTPIDQKKKGNPKAKTENEVKPNQIRKSIASSTIHRVQLRDKGQCSYKDNLGHRCSSKRFLEVHHKRPVSKGGGNHLDNLALLCSGHHKVVHLE